MDTVSVFRKSSFYITDASICDTSGNLLFYTNGLIIENKNFDTLLNSNDFNLRQKSPRFFYDFGAPTCQGAVIIPYPDSDSKYYIIYVSAEYLVANNTFEAQPLYLSYSVIDMELDAGNGGIIEDLKIFTWLMIH
ncbi:MAG: hypothetical protein IPG39_03490 [Bacteroidetes bacterium]|nr:hypothetical protein [Bacteroidota bacterium]